MPVTHMGSGARLGGSRSTSLPLQSHPKSGSATTSLPRSHISCRVAAAHSRDHSMLYWDMINETKPSGHTNQTELSVNPYSCLKNEIQIFHFSRQAHSFSDDLYLCFLFSQRRNCFLWCTALDTWTKSEMKPKNIIPEHVSQITGKLLTRSGYFSQKREQPMFGIPVNRKTAKFGTFTCEQFGGRVFLALRTEC